jgi:hypothetical protein
MNAPQTLFAGLALEGVAPGWSDLWVAAILAGAGFLFWTYYGIFQRSESRLSWALMVLRGAGLLLLVLALARPTWTREGEQVDPGRVAVVLDNSRSMSLADKQGQTRYARALKAVEKLKKALAAHEGPRLAVDLFDVNGAPLKQEPPEPTVDRSDLTRAAPA